MYRRLSRVIPMLVMIAAPAHTQSQTKSETSSPDPDVVAAEEFVRELRGPVDVEPSHIYFFPGRRVGPLIADAIEAHGIRAAYSFDEDMFAYIFILENPDDTERFRAIVEEIGFDEPVH